MEELLLGSNHFHKWSWRLPQWQISGEGKEILSLFYSNTPPVFVIKFSAVLEGCLYTAKDG
jgi:hypothetical protein